MSKTSKEHTDIFRSLLYIIKYCKKESRVPEFRLFFSLGKQIESSNLLKTPPQVEPVVGGDEDTMQRQPLEMGFCLGTAAVFGEWKGHQLAHLCKAAACPGAVPGTPPCQGTPAQMWHLAGVQAQHLGCHKTCSCLLKSNPKLSEKDTNWVEFSYITFNIPVNGL